MQVQMFKVEKYCINTRMRLTASGFPRDASEIVAYDWLYGALCTSTSEMPFLRMRTSIA